MTQEKLQDEGNIIEAEVIVDPSVDKVSDEKDEEALATVADQTPFASEKQEVSTETSVMLPAASDDKKKLNLHPFSGLLILILDYASFGAESTIIFAPIAIPLLFLVTFIGVYLIQRYIEEEEKGRSMAKAFFGAVVTAIPVPIFGTVFGSLILSISGLNFIGKWLGNLNKTKGK